MRANQLLRFASKMDYHLSTTLFVTTAGMDPASVPCFGFDVRAMFNILLVPSWSPAAAQKDGH
jgi:hypothetical protein